MIKKSILCLLLATPSFYSSADVLLGGDIEVNAWQQDYFYNNQDRGDDVTYTLEASLEHPIPLIPNVKYARSEANASSFEYTKQDFTLYYEILDNDLVSFDIGAGLTRLSNGRLNNQSFNGSLPHIYAATEIGLPTTPIFFFAKGSGISYSDTEMYDVSAGIQYAIGLGLMDLELQLGYRVQHFNVKDFDDLSTRLDTETKGFYGGVNLDF
ncbi:TIGR04219 family outer membrane beta-barrel protein [Vibrio viridaestus]|uniref:TIGR04219 family outer membrane beta-barrel protein n=1 Tax=Vibrio viridaestus TaxID=2487322 RepID=A0A3N9TYU7_9VIBR|nr:TIGR04219 family outer membrane beta-barrel protein [Vibrio viridaestus]RQW62112.1 TIGR04219 family outer membrane beta-barrel protein [Vibrio viridaestus]